MSPVIVPSFIGAALLLSVMASFVSLMAAWLLGLMAGVLALLVVMKKQAQSLQLPHAVTETELVNQFVPMAVLDQDGKVVFATPALAQLLSLEAPLAEGTLFSQSLGCDSHKLHIATDTTQTVVCNLQDKALWLSVSYRSYGQYVQCVVQDITDKKRIEELSLTDPQTGIKNQRAFDVDIDSMIKRAQRQQSHLTLAIVDIDHFNDYNQAFGHPEGDVALEKLVQCMKDTFRRPTDHLYRIGGDEFVIVFEHDTPSVCKRALERFHVNFENLHLPQPNGIVSPFLTVSVGAFGGAGLQLNDVEHLYMNADVQLYKAKENRNTVCTLFPDENQEICMEPLAKRLGV